MTNIQDPLKNRWHRSYWLKYMIAFAITALIVFSGFWIGQKTFVFDSDGWNQHFKAMVYYVQYFRGVFRNLVQTGKLIIPNWEFALGEGGDILTTLHYYAFGDPFYLPSVLVPTRFLYLYYDFAVIARLFFAGVFFSKLCLFLKKGSETAVLAGSMIYVFCSWNLANVCQHVYFINAMVFLPLLILGIEKILSGQKGWTLWIAVAVSAVSGFYFFYMLVILTAIYTVVRFAFLYRTKRESWLRMGGRILGASVLGVLCAAFIMLPVMYSVLNEARGSVDHALHVFYPLEYYSSLPAILVSSERYNWLCMGFAAPALLSVFYLMFHKGRKFFKVLCLIGLVFMIFPVFGMFFNGFSYVTNRWSFALALLFAFIVTVTWDEITETGFKDKIKLLIALACFFILCIIFPYSRQERVYLSLIFNLAFLGVILLAPVLKERSHVRAGVWNLLCMIPVIAGIIGNAYWLYSPAGENKIGRVVEAAGFNKKLSDNEASAIGELYNASKGRNQIRYSGRDLTKNANMLAGISSTQYYWSFTNPAIDEFRRKLELRECLPHSFLGYDDRSALLALSGVRCFFIPEKDKGTIPKGFKEKSKDSEGTVYENRWFVPLCYAYEECIPEETWDALPAVDKQTAMLFAAVISEQGILPETEKTGIQSEDIPFVISAQEGITITDDSFIVTDPSAVIDLEFSGKENSETYICISGLDFKGVPEYESETTIRFTPGKKASKTISYKNSEHKHYNDRHDFSVNLGYYEKAVSSVCIKFGKPGIYSCSSLSVRCQPMGHYKESVLDLADHAASSLKYGTDEISASYNAKRTSLLTFSVPYSVGWKAYVDNEPAQIVKTNIRNMGVVLQPGKHVVTLRYRTPYLKEGAITSLVGFILTAAYILFTVIRKNRSSIKK